MGKILQGPPPPSDEEYDGLPVHTGFWVRSMRFWWVNHKKTSKHELAGDFLWAPMLKANGARNHFYDNMRKASPGDWVISYSHTEVRHIGVVVDFAIPAPKPAIFKAAGDYWNQSGWLLPVSWKKLRSAVKPKLMIDHLRNLLPSKYSPLSRITGNGVQNAYLAEIEGAVFELVIGPDESVNPITEAKSIDQVLTNIDDDIEHSALSEANLSSTIKHGVVAARRGQGLFRKQVYEFEKSCRLTKICTLGLLVASHIKPWRLCDNAFERLDGANGLLLAPHVDLLFDRGFVSFTDDGDVLVSSKIATLDLERLGLTHACAQQTGGFAQRQKFYLEYHRAKVFIS